MTSKNKDTVILILKAILVFVVFFVALNVLEQFLNYFWTKVIISALFVFALFNLGEKIGLPGFGKKAKRKK